METFRSDFTRTIATYYYPDRQDNLLDHHAYCMDGHVDSFLGVSLRWRQTPTSFPQQSALIHRMSRIQILLISDGKQGDKRFSKKLGVFKLPTEASANKTRDRTHRRDCRVYYMIKVKARGLYFMPRPLRLVLRSLSEKLSCY